MGQLKSPRKSVAQYLCRVSLLLSVPFVVPHLVFAQAAAEAAGATSTSTGMTTGAKAPAVSPKPATAENNSYLAPREGPPPEEANRKTLEKAAGKDAAKLLLRSVPSGARVYINELFVGRAPLLLIVSPGKYRVQMRGERQELGERVVGLLPNDTQNVTIGLILRYPSRISVK